ncbi:xanthine dehydrogenase family protein subunit M [Hoeflea sp. TYP-13]|uniref:xanthine dehydrogenase family protein subunit M n=1 Tax=Hoeflea sp. TYP-13 TaxID=3230023 RepID=UPI0034C614A8
MSREFDLHMPDSLEDALNVLSDMESTPLAGGTNLLVDVRSQRERPKRVVALGRVTGLRGISFDGEKTVVGARTTISDLLQSPEIANSGPSLIEAARVFAGQMVRNAGTVGGNIACASPAADLIPPLMSLDAEVTLAGSSGNRTVALADYYQGYKQDIRRPDELITRISWAQLPRNSVNMFYKLARRKGDAITVTSVAVTLSMSNGKCAGARIALGAVAPCVVRAKEPEQLLEGQILSETLIADAAEQAAAQCNPIDDVRASAVYRRHCVQVLVGRLLLQAWNRLA